MSASAADRRIRSLRPPKTRVDPYAAHGSLLEEERRPDGKIERALTVFLAGAECAFTCSFCDLWRWTIDGPTPPGALTRQLETILQALDDPLPDRLKLYNASNFFDPRAVPSEDVPGIATLAASFAGVTVESHVNTIGRQTLAFARQIAGRLEVAAGLETIHPVASAQLNKRLDLARFDWAVRFLSENGVDLRVFVLLGAPCVAASESISWTVRTVEYAVERGASVISIIPVRGGNGEMERLQALGHFAPPSLSQLEAALDLCLQFTHTVVTADLWDVERLPACEHCRSARIERLRRLNVIGRAEPRIDCSVCGAA
ncbi:MAG: radical SAM protein [Gemmatimonadaceae bacterium]|nr:radical SAM protein [Gemmatimonadaceae bacterium]